MRVFTTNSIGLAAFLAVYRHRNAQITVTDAKFTTFTFLHDSQIEGDAQTFHRQKVNISAKLLLERVSSFKKEVVRQRVLQGFKQ